MRTVGEEQQKLGLYNGYFAQTADCVSHITYNIMCLANKTKMF